MKFGRIIAAALAVVFIAALIYAFVPRRYEASFYPMGGIPFEVVVYGRNYIEFDKDFAAVENRVEELDRVFNRYSKTSEITRLNEDAASAPFWAGPDIEDAIKISEKWNRISWGAFDLSVAPLVDMWREAGKLGVMPSKGDITERMKAVGLSKINFVDNGMIKFSVNGMALDFGAIAKGYIVDQVVKTLKKRRVKRGIVNAGGDGYAFGEGTFRFGIQDPTKRTGELIGTVEVSNGAVVTSGNYERYVEIDGKKYSHIINPRTGWPVEDDLVSVTVIGGSAADADALATSLIVLGKDEGISLLKDIHEFKALMVRKWGDEYSIWVSKELSGSVQLKPGWSEKVHTF